VDALLGDDDLAEKCRDLITRFIDEIPSPLNASSGFLYLMALIKSNKLRLSERNDRILAVDVAMKVHQGLSGQRTKGVVNLAARDVLRWFIGDTLIGSRGFPDWNTASELEEEFTENNEIDVCVIQLAPRDDNSTVTALIDLLEEHLVLSVIRGDAYMLPISHMTEMIARSKSLIIVDNGSPSTQFQSEILDQLQRSAVVIGVRLAGDDSSVQQSRLAECWPCVVFNQATSKSCQAESLLRAIANWSFSE
jgi:hypothetical protein